MNLGIHTKMVVEAGLMIVLSYILHFIVLLAGLFTFYKLSNNSEIVIMRSSGRSIFQIIKFPYFLTSVSFPTFQSIGWTKIISLPIQSLSLILL